jgi:hypothetical protein
MKLLLLGVVICCLILPAGCAFVFPKVEKNPVHGFAFKYNAEIYAWRARRAGYETKMSYTADSWLTGAHWWVSIWPSPDISKGKVMP